MEPTTEPTTDAPRWMCSSQHGLGCYNTPTFYDSHHKAEVACARMRALVPGTTQSWVAQKGHVFPTPKVKPYRKNDTEWAVFVEYADGTKVRLAQWYAIHRHAVLVADHLLVQNPDLAIILEEGAPPKPAATPAPITATTPRPTPAATLTLSLDL